MSERNLGDYFLTTGEGGENLDWREIFDDRQQKEIALAEIYARDFAHGTTGHNALLVIAKMAAMLDKLDARVRKADS
jgi:hypothetical protein